MAKIGKNISIGISIPKKDVIKIKKDINGIIKLLDIAIKKKKN